MAHIHLPFHWHVHIYKKVDGMQALYANLFLRCFALYTFGIFVPLYILELAQEVYGASLSEGLAFIAAFYFLSRVVYFVLIFPAARVIYTLGARWSIFLSNIFLFIHLLTLIWAKENILFLGASVLANGAVQGLYWISYHFLLTTDSHQDKRGSEISKTGLLSRIAWIMGPLIGGLLVANFSFKALFAFSMVLVFLSSIPPFFMKHHTVWEHPVIFSDVLDLFREKKNWRVFFSLSLSMIKSVTDGVFWPVAVFLILENYSDLGFLISLPGILTIWLFWLVGWLYDNWNRARVLMLGVVLNSLVWLGRAVVSTFWGIFGVGVGMRISNPPLWVSYDSLIYEWARKNPLNFIVGRAVVWQFSAALWFFLLMIGFWFGLSLPVVFVMTAVSVLGHLLILESKDF